MAGVRPFFEALLDVVLPPTCHICHASLTNTIPPHICPACHDQLPVVTPPFCELCGVPFTGVGTLHRCGQCLLHPPHFDAAWAPYLYESAMRDLIHRFKYNHAVFLRKSLSLLMEHCAAQYRHNYTADLVVPVPLHRSRLRQRGFNQAVLLAGPFSRRCAVPMTPDILIRTRSTIPQVELTAEERRANVSGAFAVKRAAEIQGKSILLLDDVITTGSTMNECAKVLKKSGATRVAALAIARTPH